MMFPGRTLLRNQTRRGRLSLAGLEARVLLVDDVGAALAADDAAVLVTLLQRTERVADLHRTYAFKMPGNRGQRGAETSGREWLCQRAMVTSGVGRKRRVYKGLSWICRRGWLGWFGERGRHWLWRWRRARHR